MNSMVLALWLAVLDIVGTGGDGIGSVNISTGATVIAAAAGARVAKHGNRSVSSLCGSADVVEVMLAPVIADQWFAPAHAMGLGSLARKDNTIIDIQLRSMGHASLAHYALMTSAACGSASAKVRWPRNCHPTDTRRRLLSRWENSEAVR